MMANSLCANLLRSTFCTSAQTLSLGTARLGPPDAPALSLLDPRSPRPSRPSLASEEAQRNNSNDKSMKQSTFPLLIKRRIGHYVRIAQLTAILRTIPFLVADREAILLLTAAPPASC